MKNWQRYPEYKDSGVEWLGEIPKHWNILKLKHLGDINLSNVDKKSKENEDPVKLCNYVDVYYNDYITEEIEFMIATASHEQKKTFSLRKGDVLLTKDSETWNDIAIAAYVATNLDNVICGYHLAHIRPYQSKALGKYIFRAISSTRLKEKFWVAANGVTRFGISKSSILSVLLPVPPLSEQKAIAHFLDRETSKLDKLIAKKQRFIELLQEKRTALISHAVTKGLNPDIPMKDSGISWLGQIPKHWEVKKLKYFIKKIEQGWSPSCENRPAENQEWGVLKVGCVNGHELDQNQNKALPSNLEPRSDLEIKTGDILLSRANTIELVGSAVVVKEVRPKLILCDKLYRVSINSNFLDKNFLVLCLSSSLSRFQMEIDATGASSSMQNIGQDTIKKILIPLPSVDEQIKILSFLDQETAKIDTLIEKTKTSIEKLKEYRTALISAAVTGKIDIREEI